MSKYKSIKKIREEKSNFWANKKQKSKIVKGFDTNIQTKGNENLNKQNLDENLVELDGIVVANLGNFFEVQLCKNNFQDLDELVFTCISTGAIKSENEHTIRDGNLIVVGDKVKFIQIESKNDEVTYQGVIKKVLFRNKFLSRQAAGRKKKEQILASNIAKVIIFVAADSPPYNKRLIDRYLIAAEQNLLEAIIVVNKVDLFPKRLFEHDLKVYKDLGHKIFYFSTLKPGRYKKEIDKLKNTLLDKEVNGYSIITGPSGVGKSSFLNLFFGDDIQIVNEVSESTSKGLHTTSFSRLFMFDSEHGIIDSPGIREFGLWQFEKSEIRLYFHDFDKFKDNCKYNGCTHEHEPNCAIKEAVENGKLDQDRYMSYINIMQSNPEDIF